MASQKLRNKLIATAQRFFYTQGYESTSVNDIIHAAGVSKGAFYHHFASKQEILKAVIDGMAEETQASIAPVMADLSLDAIRRYRSLARVINDWRLERKSAMVAMLCALQRDENLRLWHYLRAEGTKVFVPALVVIIAQGVEEGVFDTEWVEESAALAFGIHHTSQKVYIDLLLHPEKYDDPVTKATRQFAADQAATERILGAPPGSLSIIDQDAIAAWFGQSKARR